MNGAGIPIFYTTILQNHLSKFDYTCNVLVSQYSVPKINENNESLVWSPFELDKANCLHLLPIVMYSLQFFF